MPFKDFSTRSRGSRTTNPSLRGTARGMSGYQACLLILRQISTTQQIFDEDSGWPNGLNSVSPAEV
jgi:hypothetical protein